MNTRTYRGFALENVGLSWYWVGCGFDSRFAGPGYSRRYIGQSFAEAKRWIQQTVAASLTEALYTAGRMAGQ